MAIRYATTFFVVAIVASWAFGDRVCEKVYADESFGQTQQFAEGNNISQGVTPEAQPASSGSLFDELNQRIASLGMNSHGDEDIVLEANKISVEIAKINDPVQQDTLRSFLELKMGQLQ